MKKYTLDTSMLVFVVVLTAEEGNNFKSRKGMNFGGGNFLTPPNIFMQFVIQYVFVYVCIVFSNGKSVCGFITLQVFSWCVHNVTFYTLQFYNWCSSRFCFLMASAYSYSDSSFFCGSHISLHFQPGQTFLLLFYLFVDFCFVCYLVLTVVQLLVRLFGTLFFTALSLFCQFYEVVLSTRFILIKHVH